mmetsp:Transcript_9296/g.17160  ORF Transcript_9296/g.17160 Transcript_9296/m.17160 type:complete len:91 (-) Transcript_9296:1466-1738(-)
MVASGGLGVKVRDLYVADDVLVALLYEKLALEALEVGKVRHDDPTADFTGFSGAELLVFGVGVAQEVGLGAQCQIDVEVAELDGNGREGL